MSPEILNNLPLAIQIFVKSPFWYKSLLLFTFSSAVFLTYYSFKMYIEGQKHHDFDASNVRISVEKEFNERTLSFDIESLGELAVYINQIQIGIYDTKKQ